MTQRLTPRQAAKHLYELGANITAIPVGGKEPNHKWASRSAPWATTRQPDAFIDSLRWPSAPRMYNGELFQPIETIGVICGINGWRWIDVDAVKRSDGTKAEVPELVRDALLAALGLPASYEWAGRSRSGAGWHIAVRCTGDLPADVASACSERKAADGGGAGVKLFVPRDAYIGAFDHIELRWELCQTVLPTPTGYNGHIPSEAPAEIAVEQILSALYAVAMPRPRRKAPETAAPPKSTETSPQRINLDAAEREIDRCFDLVEWFKAELGGDTQDEPGGEIRILGHQGLVVNPERGEWFIFGEETGGRWAMAVALTRYGGKMPRGRDYIDLVRVAAAFAGVALQAAQAAPQAAQAAQATQAAPQAAQATQAAPQAAQAAQAAPQAAQAERLGPTAKLAAALEAAGYLCELNSETDEITINGALLSDITRALLRSTVRDQRLGPVEILDDAVTLQAKQHEHAPIRDGLDTLEWDGGEHIAALARCLLTDPDAKIHYGNGTTRRDAEVFLLRWLLGAVGRVFESEQNAMLVLDGPQGIGKSSLVKWLGGVLPGVYCEESINPQEKDCLLRLTRTLVWEAGELDATTRKHDVAALKHFLTRSTVTARRAYGRHDMTKPVLTSFIGTVNTNGNGFLPDPTGNRRYMVLSLTGIDWRYQQLDQRQVWAEAVARYRGGERGRLSADEAAHRDLQNAEQHQVIGLLDDWISMHFKLTGCANDMLTSGEIAAHLRTHDIILGGNDRAAAMSIADAMTRAGITQADRRAAQRRYGRFQRAWAGIVVKTTGSTGAEWEEEAIQPPPAIQPRSNLQKMVGSSRPNAKNDPGDPTDPTSETTIGEDSNCTAANAPTPPPQPQTLKDQPEAGSVGSWLSDAMIQPSEGLDRLDRPAPETLPQTVEECLALMQAEQIGKPLLAAKPGQELARLHRIITRARAARARKENPGEAL